jgi:glycosyltransferase involved in cell wall biosynthesis
MRLVARDARVLWVNSIGYRTPSALSKADMGRAMQKLAALATPISEVEKNIFVFSPLAVPLYGPVGRTINSKILCYQIKQAMRKLAMSRVMNWIFNPAAGVIAGKLGEERVIYHCVDEYTAFSGVGASQLAETEKRLLARADLTIASADLLYESKRRMNPNTVLIRHGVDYNHFRKALDPATEIPADVANLPRPIIGFFGLVADWVDIELMAHMARHFACGSLVVLGKVTTDVSALAALPNVHLVGRKPYSQLPAYAKAFDVALNPFRVNRLTLNANPLKVREYLAAGLPVVATPIPEVEMLDQCRVAADGESFVREIEAALKDPGPKRWRSQTMRDQSWESKLDEICTHLAGLEEHS